MMNALGSVVFLLTLQASYSATYFQQPVVFQTSSSFLLPGASSTGWGDSESNGSGYLVYTTQGLDLAWEMDLGGVWYWRITNVEDVTGEGPFLDRYISTTFDPRQRFGVDQYRAYMGFAANSYSMEVNEGFEIRSSLDGFASPLIRMVGVPDRNSLGVFPEGTTEVRYNPDYPWGTAYFSDPGTGTVNVTQTSLVETYNEPIEFRYYYWDSEDVDGTGAEHSGVSAYTFYVLVDEVPEPSAFLLLGAGSAIGLVRRRR